VSAAVGVGIGVLGAVDEGTNDEASQSIVQPSEPYEQMKYSRIKSLHVPQPQVAMAVHMSTSASSHATTPLGMALFTHDWHVSVESNWSDRQPRAVCSNESQAKVGSDAGIEGDSTSVGEMLVGRDIVGETVGPSTGAAVGGTTGAATGSLVGRKLTGCAVGFTVSGHVRVQLVPRYCVEKRHE
jgi:hypothetical protein